MTLEKFIENLKTLAEEHPETLAYEVVTAIDDEGNGFNPVYFTPSLGRYEDNDFNSIENLKEDSEEDSIEIELNAVCVN